MNDCGCIYVGNFDEPEFYKSKKLMAKKNHDCGECGNPIYIDTKYEYVSAKWEGKISSYKTCSVCLDIRRVFFCDGWLFEGIFEALHEHIQEMDGEISENCLIGLGSEARGVVCDIIEDYWEEL